MDIYVIFLRVYKIRLEFTLCGQTINYQSDVPVNSNVFS